MARNTKKLIERTALLEQYLSAIKVAQKENDYHHSKAVELSVINSDSAIAEAIKSLALGDKNQAERSLNVAFFYAKFAQDILAADATEHILGQDSFLDLLETSEQIMARIDETMEQLTARLAGYRELFNANGRS